MFYTITGLCPCSNMPMGGYGFCVQLHPGFEKQVARSGITAVSVHHLLDEFGREWLDRCGFGQMYDPDNCGFERDKSKPPGSRAHKLYMPNRDLRVSWGRWGPEHISVPGDACGLDLTDNIGAPRGGRLLSPHNVDNWSQVQLLLVTFCHFAETVELMGGEHAV